MEGFNSALAEFAEPFLEEGIIVQGVDDVGEMAVNPVQLQRMETMVRSRAKLAKGGPSTLPKAVGLPRPGAWAKLGISVVEEETKCKQVEQLKKLEKFLEKERGVIVPPSPDKAQGGVCERLPSSSSEGGKELAVTTSCILRPGSRAPPPPFSGSTLGGQAQPSCRACDRSVT